MTDRTTARRAVALLAAVVLAVVAALALGTSSAVADTGPAAGPRVAASDHDLGTSVGADRSISAGERRGTTTPEPGTAVGSCVAPQTGGDDCEPECVQSPIIPNEGAVGHIYSKHYPGGARNVPGEATFYADEDLYDLLDLAEQFTPWEDGANCKRHVDAGRPIGTPLGSSIPTSIYTVITSKRGVLVTAFPGEG